MPKLSRFDELIETICPLCLTRRSLSWDAAYRQRCCLGLVWFYKNWKENPPVEARSYELGLLPPWARGHIETVAANSPDLAAAVGRSNA